MVHTPIRPPHPGVSKCRLRWLAELLVRLPSNLAPESKCLFPHIIVGASSMILLRRKSGSESESSAQGCPRQSCTMFGYDLLAASASCRMSPADSEGSDRKRDLGRWINGHEMLMSASSETRAYTTISNDYWRQTPKLALLRFHRPLRSTPALPCRSAASGIEATASGASCRMASR